MKNMVAAFRRYWAELVDDLTGRSPWVQYDTMFYKLFPSAEDRAEFRDACLLLAQAGWTGKEVAESVVGWTRQRWEKEDAEFGNPATGKETE